MGKVKTSTGKLQYAQKFRREWLHVDTFKNWLLECPNDASKASCKYCRCEIKAKLSDLQSHVKTKKHTSAAAPFSSTTHRQTTLVLPKVTYRQAEAEGRLAMFVCNHSAIMAVDHLGLLCKSSFEEDLAASQLKIHRTKCSGIIQCVLYPHFQKDLLDSIQTGFEKYSLFLDESTDISVKKLLAVGINFFDGNTVVSTFLTLNQLTSCDAETLYNTVKETLIVYKLPIENLVGIATDNASTMVGVNNGLYVKLKADVPGLILIKCVCHSLQLAVSHAVADTLPRTLEYLASETYNWFSRSSARKETYSELYKTINNGNEPKKIVQACNTRWLSIECAITGILDQFIELKCHFMLLRQSERCYIAEVLYNMYNDETNLLFLLFLQPVLSSVQQVNKAFESNNVDPLKLFDDLVLLINSIANMIILPGHDIDPVKDDIDDYINKHPYLGFGFENKAMELRKSGKLTAEVEKNIRERCTNFLISLYNQIKQRLPENIKVMEKISLFSVSNALTHQKLPITELLQSMNLKPLLITQIENEFNKLHLTKWNETENTVKFWAEVYKHRNASGENPFKNICDVALTFLVLPMSNAEVERIFSQVNLIKNKMRNKLSLRDME